MKKTYAAPAVSLQRFVVNENVATSSLCGTSTYSAVTVYCLINGNETIYSSSTSACNYAIDGTAGTSYCFYKASDGCFFLIWPNKGGGFNNKSDTVTGTGDTDHNLSDIQNAAYKAGYLTSTAGDAYHIAPVTSQVISQIAKS